MGCCWVKQSTDPPDVSTADCTGGSPTLSRSSSLRTQFSSSELITTFRIQTLINYAEQERHLKPVYDIGNRMIV
jgi:hypothetical protein